MNFESPYSFDRNMWQELISKPQIYPFAKDPALESQILLPRKMDDVWSFFNDPHNLVKLTSHGQKVTLDADVPHQMETGMTFGIKSAVGLFHFHWNVHFPFTWDHPAEKGFIDIQVYKKSYFKFPFKRWCHCHLFIEQSPHSTLVIDRIRWQSSLPTPFHLVANWETERQLKMMLVHRYKILTQLFS